jgi:hypothetical protein
MICVKELTSVRRWHEILRFAQNDRMDAVLVILSEAKNLTPLAVAVDSTQH